MTFLCERRGCNANLFSPFRSPLLLNVAKIPSSSLDLFSRLVVLLDTILSGVWEIELKWITVWLLLQNPPRFKNHRLLHCWDCGLIFIPLFLFLADHSLLCPFFPPFNLGRVFLICACAATSFPEDKHGTRLACTMHLVFYRNQRKEGRHIRLRTCSIRDIGTVQILHSLFGSARRQYWHWYCGCSVSISERNWRQTGLIKWSQTCCLRPQI